MMNNKTTEELLENQNALITILKQRLNLYRLRSEILEENQKKIIRELGYLKSQYDSLDERKVIDRCVEIIREIYE